jgi:sulfate transport system permease protein
MSVALRAPSPRPGFGLAFGITLAMLSVVVLLPVGALLTRGALIGPTEMLQAVGSDRVCAALALSFRAALGASLVNSVLGVALAWVLVRYRFPGRPLVDAAVDLPFALPTAVAGIALTALYAPNGAFGQVLGTLDLRVAYTEVGIWLALVFVGLPFVVRTVQPVIEEVECETEEASATLGASRAMTLRRVVLPMLTPAILTGFALALARSVGEYGSVIFIAGNLPVETRSRRS